MKKITVISAFDGLGGGRLALQRAGIPVENYYAFEIDKWAIKIAAKNFKDIVHLGDINNWRFFDELPTPDLIIGGSPCQGFSIAGDGLNFDDPRSKLFFTFVDLVNFWKERNPNLKFMLENVKMKAVWRDVISNYLGVTPVLINSSLVSAQNRERYYWANWNITQPNDLGITLSDILEDDGIGVIQSHGKLVQRKDKSMCLDANYHKGADNHGQRTMIVRGAAIRNQITKNGIEEQLNIRKDEKSNCVVPSYPHKLNGMVQVGTADINGHDILKRVYSKYGKSPTLSAHSGGNSEPKIDVDGVHWRKLTPIECERLQTLPDNYTEGVSNTQRYKMIGNGWTIDVVSHILKEMCNENRK